MNSSYRPPIPEVKPSPLPAAPAAPRPALLDAIAAILALSTPLSLWLLSPSRMTQIQIAPPSSNANPYASDIGSTFGLGFSIGVLVISLLVTYFLWRGNNTARILIMIGSVLSFLNLGAISQYDDPVSKLYLILDVAFSAYLLFWLSRPAVAAYFKNPART